MIELMLGKYAVSDLLKNPENFLKVGLINNYGNVDSTKWVAVAYLGIFVNDKTSVNYRFAVWSENPDEDEFLFNLADVTIDLTTGKVVGDYHGMPDEEFDFDIDPRFINSEWKKYVSRNRVR